MLALYRDTDEKKYLEYAQHIAQVQTRFIREDGSMPYRVRPATGEVVEEYTTGHAHVASFLDTLHSISPDPRWPVASRRIVGWLVNNPLRNYDWKACFEDVGTRPPFSNLSGMDALAAVRLLCRHAGEDSSYLAHARKLMRWVEDQFVSFGDEASLFVHTYYPAVREQWVCDYNMEGHSANYAASCRALHDATGDAVWRRKEIATLNAIVRSQRADGALSTWGIDRETGLGGLGHGFNWFNANHSGDAELLNFVLLERKEGIASEDPF